MGTRTPAPPAPSTFRRCAANCGRLVWHHDTGLCAQCDPRSRRARENGLNGRLPATKPPRRRLRPCGTVAAYKRHLRAKEDPCAACLDAANQDRKQYPWNNTNRMG